MFELFFCRGSRARQSDGLVLWRARLRFFNALDRIDKMELDSDFEHSPSFCLKFVIANAFDRSCA